MRLESDFEKSDFDIHRFQSNFQKRVGQDYRMEWSLHTDENKPKMAIFVSKYNHCIYDLLSRFKAGELHVEIPFIISNHEDLAYIGEQFKVPFFHVPFTKHIRTQAEKEQIQLLEEYNIDFIVLARYMQIIGEDLIYRYTNKIINIHHSFLPAFVGAKPYHAAFKRGVKIIGATSHYVTKELDAGPIIEQDVAAVSHVHSVADFISKGQDLEKIVLSRAVKLHHQRKTMVYNNKTIIFS